MFDCPIPDGYGGSSSPSQFGRSFQGTRLLWSCLHHCLW
uniref:Uncharacterized protein n=1 Tax=Brassica oleracea TaxID=3712 RepID=A0A3P6HC93_BRAOL|nr:unnamed protein product [Brassica oleracea]